MADGDPLTFHKLLEGQPIPVPNGIGFIRTPTGMQIAVTDDAGAQVGLDQHLHFSFGSAGKPAAGAEFGRYLAPVPLTISETLGQAISTAPADAACDVTISFAAGGVAARFHWDAGDVVATLEVVEGSVDEGAVLIFSAPAIQDATLAGINATLVLVR